MLMRALAVLERPRYRFVASLTFGVLAAYVWHLGHPDPPWEGDFTLAYWLHWAQEGMLTGGLSLSAFVLGGAILRFVRAQYGQISADTPLPIDHNP